MKNCVFDNINPKVSCFLSSFKLLDIALCNPETFLILQSITFECYKDLRKSHLILWSLDSIDLMLTQGLYTFILFHTSCGHFIVHLSIYCNFVRSNLNLEFVLRSFIILDIINRFVHFWRLHSVHQLCYRHIHIIGEIYV
jgi:hypothetical protein